MFISFTRQLARSGEDVVYGKIIDKNDRVLNYCMYYSYTATVVGRHQDK